MTGPETCGPPPRPARAWRAALLRLGLLGLPASVVVAWLFGWPGLALEWACLLAIAASVRGAPGRAA